MNQSNFIKMAVSVLLILFFSTSLVLVQAEEMPKEPTEANSVEELEKQEQLIKQKEEIMKMMKELLNTLQSDMNEIDKKVDSLRTKQEYENYPAVRLNVDTPFFGIASIVNNKLKITKEVSTGDVTSGFSIRDVVANKVIKVPDVTFVGLTITTREIKLNQDISIADANIALLKLIGYVDQVQGVSTFLDNQINKIFNGYVKQEKMDTIASYQKRLEEDNNILLQQDKKITYMLLLGEEELNSKVTTYQNLSKRLYGLKKQLKNILIEDEALVEVQKDMVTLEGELLGFSEQIDNLYQSALKEMEIEKVLVNARSEIKTIYLNMNTYIKNSVEVKNVDKIDTESQDIENKENLEKTAEDISTNLDLAKTTEEIQKYDVASKDMLEYYMNTIKEIDELYKKYVGRVYIDEENEGEIDPEVINKNEVTSITTEEITKEKAKEILDLMYQKYQESLQKEESFYLNNVNLLIKDTTYKISNLSTLFEENVLKNVQYMYLTLPERLETILLVNNMNSNIENKTIIESFKKELTTMIQSNIEINKVYQENNKRQE